jgi:hypothetical protein
MNRAIFMVLAVGAILASGMIGSRPALEESFVPGELVVFFVDDGQAALDGVISKCQVRGTPMSTPLDINAVDTRILRQAGPQNLDAPEGPA